MALSNETINLMKRFLFLLLFLSIPVVNLFPQAKLDNRNNFYQAENFVLYEEYKEALPLYTRLLIIEPDNSNFKYRIGQCLLNMPGRKSEAITYLEDAVEDINFKYKEGKYNEKKAPYDAYYYLANAYRINNQLSKALDTYELFKKNLDPDVYDSTVVNLQITSCRNAQQLLKVPFYIRKENLGDIVNGRFSDYNPVLSADESVMVYNQAAAFQDFIFFTKKVNGKWSTPVDIIPDLGLGFEEKNFVTSISDDGRELFIYRPGLDYDGNIYVTRRDMNDKWSNLVKLNENINTKYWESHATISHDGKKLYFTSNRKGTVGGLDIYVSQRDSIGEWGPAMNIGPVINTVYNEESPFLGKDNKTLFFSSRGHFNVGGYDVFYSTFKENAEWSIPLNLGFPLNSTDDDVFFNPVKDGYQAYYALDDSGSYGLQDIYRIEIFNNDHPRKFYIRGIVQVKDLMEMFGTSIKVSALNLDNLNDTVIVFSNPVTGEYEFKELPQGNYSLTYEVPGAKKTTKNINLLLNNPIDSFVLPGTTLPKTDFVAEMIVAGNKTISVVNNDTISFPVKVEPQSILVVEHWLGDSLLTTETFRVNDTAFIYRTVPLTGENRLVFKLTDKFSNSITSDIFIKREKVTTEQSVERPEYSRVIAQKQSRAFISMLNNRADNKLKKIIGPSGIENKQSGKVDDIISYLKEETAKRSISPDEVDKLALRVAVMDNVLTQAAVDIMTRNTHGELNEILGKLNIYDAGLKTWTDLQKFISEKTNGKISPEELNKIAADILTDTDNSIAKVGGKILMYGDKSPAGEIIRQAVSITNSKNIKNGGKWLQSVYNEAVNLNMKNSEIADMLVKLSSLPGTKVEKYIEELAAYSDESLRNYLNGPEMKKAGIKTPEEVILYLLKNKDKGIYSEISLFDALSRLIESKDIPAGTIYTPIAVTEGNYLWIIWLILGTGVVAFVFIIGRRKKKEKK